MRYFAYGANLSHAHMALWCHGATPLVKAVLPDHRLVFRLWADIAPSPGKEVRGALYEVSLADMDALDQSEDCPDLARSKTIVVRTAQGNRDAFAYQMNPGRLFAPPAPDYLALILEGYEDWRLDPAALPIPDGPTATP